MWRFHHKVVRRRRGYYGQTKSISNSKLYIQALDLFIVEYKTNTSRGYEPLFMVVHIMTCRNISGNKILLYQIQNTLWLIMRDLNELSRSNEKVSTKQRNSTRYANIDKFIQNKGLTEYRIFGYYFHMA